MKLFSGFLALAILCAPASTSAQALSPERLAHGQRVAARYDSAFASLVAIAKRDSAAFAWLLDLSRFKAEHIGWGYESNGRLMAITPARRNAWLTIVPADDSAYARMGSLMESDFDASVRSTRVKADTISAEWSAVFLSFELSHLRDDVLNIMPENPKPSQFDASTRRAYSAEYLAARAFGGRAMEKHLDSVITAMAPQSSKDFAERLISVLQSSFNDFDALVSKHSALTEREEQRRGGVYAAALLLRYAEQHNVSDAAFAAALRCIGGCR
jgi:hypothetical protein